MLKTAQSFNILLKLKLSYIAGYLTVTSYVHIIYLNCQYTSWRAKGGQIMN